MLVRCASVLAAALMLPASTLAQGPPAAVDTTPKITFGGATQPSGDEIAKLHEHAHHECFIASSVLTEITVEPR